MKRLAVLMRGQVPGPANFATITAFVRCGKHFEPRRKRLFEQLTYGTNVSAAGRPMRNYLTGRVESFNRFRFSQYARELSKAVQELSMPTIGEQLKAARADLAKARGEAAVAGSDAAGAAKAVLIEVGKVKAETADLLAEIAELTNGGPVLDDSAPVLPPASFP